MPRKQNGTSTEKSIVIFEDQPVRRVWNKKDNKWYFPIVDVIKILTDSTDGVRSGIGNLYQYITSTQR